jgi:hypothetical protein
MSDQMEGGWSNRKKTITVTGTLGAIASLVTIVSFLTGHSSPTPVPSPSPTSAVSSVYPTDSPTSTISVYPASAQNSILSNCEATSGAPASYCQCNVSWLEATIPYSTFVQAPDTYEQEADGYASC